MTQTRLTTTANNLPIASTEKYRSKFLPKENSINSVSPPSTTPIPSAAVTTKPMPVSVSSTALFLNSRFIRIQIPSNTGKRIDKINIIRTNIEYNSRIIGVNNRIIISTNNIVNLRLYSTSYGGELIGFEKVDYMDNILASTFENNIVFAIIDAVNIYNEENDNK